MEMTCCCLKHLVLAYRSIQTICNLAIEFNFAQKKLLSLFACGDQGMHVHAWDSLTNYSFTMKKKKKEDGDDDDQGQGRA